MVGDLRALPDATPDLLRALESSAPNPAGDAARAAARNDFRFVYSAFGRGGHSRSLGVICHTPYKAGTVARASADWGDSIDVDSGGLKQRYDAYGAAFNRAMVDHPAFPYADLCAPVEPRDDPYLSYHVYALIGRPARTLTRKPLTLHEAARRGSPGQLRSFLRRENVDDIDAFGMTALAWAVAYDRDDIVTLLLAAGASSTLATGDVAGVSPILAAIVQNRLAILSRLTLPKPLPAELLDVAIRDADAEMVRVLFDMPHESPRFDWLPSLRTDVAAIIIAHEGKRGADAILALGAKDGRLDLVLLAIASGADVNAYANTGETPLLAALNGYGEEAPLVVETLLSAGANPNKRIRAGSGYDTSFWRAYENARYSSRWSPELLARFVRAGGDAGVMRWPDTPSAWTVVFPMRGNLNTVKPPPVDMLRVLLDAGMDLNAPYQNRCLLDVVEASVGPDTEVSLELRSLGAMRRSASGACTVKP